MDASTGVESVRERESACARERGREGGREGGRKGGRARARVRGVLCLLRVCQFPLCNREGELSCPKAGPGIEGVMGLGFRSESRV